MPKAKKVKKNVNEEVGAERKERPFLDVIAGEVRAVAERFKLTPEQSDALREFVATTAMRAWRNGRNIGWLRAKEGQTSGGTKG